MTSIVSIVAAFMATFVLVFGYLTYSEQAPAEPDRFTAISPDTPAGPPSPPEQ